MKILSGILLFVLLGITGYAQQGSGGAKVIAEIAAGSERIVKNSPFSAEAVSESVQILADGNRIVRSTNSKLYRNSEGRFRREFAGGSGNVLGSTYSFGQGVTILDPAAGHRYMLDSTMKTARVVDLKPGMATTVVGTAPAAIAERAAVTRALAAPRVAVEGSHEGPGSSVIISTGQTPHMVTGVISRSPTEPVYAYGIGGGPKYETRTEQLGTQSIEGVNAEGTRTVTTIPAGAIGNERPIDTVYEKWYSPELDLVVMSKHTDPRFGEQTYRLTNITRSEPDPSLFSLPTGYKLLSKPEGVYRPSTTKYEAEKAAAASKVAGKP